MSGLSDRQIKAAFLTAMLGEVTANMSAILYDFRGAMPTVSFCFFQPADEEDEVSASLICKELEKLLKLETLKRDLIIDPNPLKNHEGVQFAYLRLEGVG